MTLEKSIVGDIAHSLPAAGWLGVIAVTYLLYLAYLAFFHPLHKIPGPFLARFSELWRNIRYFRGSWLEDVVALHQTYGPVVRIAPNEVSFVDGEALKQLYGHGKPSQKVRPSLSFVLPPNVPSGFAG